MTTKICDTHNSLLKALISLIKETENRVLEAEDAYFTDNANYFCKSFLVTACTYLEAYLKGVAAVIITETEERLKANTIASNIVRWSLDKANLKVIKFERFALNISEKDIDDNISGNVDRTIIFFKKLGIDLDSSPSFFEKQDKIAPVIVKRNNIVHYNDDASDLSLGDVALIIDEISEYIIIIDKWISDYMHPCITDPFI